MISSPTPYDPTDPNNPGCEACCSGTPFPTLESQSVITVEM